MGKNSRFDKMVRGENYEKKLETKLNDVSWKAKYDLMKAGNESYSDICKKRETARETKAKAVENVDVIDKKLVALLSKISKAILIEIDKNDLKLNEFFIQGNVTNIISDTVDAQIVSVKHMIKGFESNQNYEFSSKYYNELKDTLLKLEDAYKTLVAERDKEAAIVKETQKADDNYDALLRKIEHFIENEEK